MKNYKDLVSLIKKEAQAVAIPALKSVQEMQQLIINFCAELKKTSVLNAQDPNYNAIRFFLIKELDKNKGAFYRETVEEQQTDQVANNKKISDIKNISNIILTIERIGTPRTVAGGKGETVVDGKWGPRTTNALKLIEDIRQSFSAILHGDVKPDEKNHLLIVDPYPKDAQEADKLATQNKVKLKELTELILQEIETLINSDDYKDFSNQKNSFHDVKTVANVETKGLPDKIHLSSTVESLPDFKNPNDRKMFYQSFILNRDDLKNIFTFKTALLNNEKVKEYLTSLKEEEKNKFITDLIGKLQIDQSQTDKLGVK